MLENLDRHMLLAINSLNSPFFDNVMYAISGKLIWAPLYLAILIYLGFGYRRKFLVILIFIVLLITLSDQISVQLFKNIFHRLRPCHDPSLAGMIHLVRGHCGGLYGFVSSHASNSFAIAFLSMKLIKKKWYGTGMMIWALVICYSRVYLGVHYPGDVICGALLGALIGLGVYRLYEITDRKILSGKTFFSGQSPDRPSTR